MLNCFAADRRAQFVQLEYGEEDYQKELEHIEEVRTFIYRVSLEGLSHLEILSKAF